MSAQARLFAVATKAFRARVPELNQLPFVAVDCFAGGGGASAAIEQASGHAPVLAINHDPAAIAMHRANHPGTYHLCEDIFDVEPNDVAQGLRIDLAWFSPDCTHFSRAKGGKPRKKEIRALAWIVVKWAQQVRPRVICLENVVEFITWGPLDEAGHIIEARKGETFNEWREQLEELGYRVEWRVLNAADHGAPTSRKRLFFVARCDDEEIVWPEPTHGEPPLEPYRAAAECIDWSLPCPSIFNRKKPLAEKTQARIAEGLRRYFFEPEEPFLVNLQVPTLMANNTNNAPGTVEEPLKTITTGNRHYLVASSLINTRNGEREGQAPRARDIERPLGTITAQGSQGALVAAFLAKHYGGVVGNDLRTPMGSITAKDSQGLVAAHLTKFYGTSTGANLLEPAPTVTGQGQHLGLVAANVIHHRGRSVGRELGAPLPTVTASGSGHLGLVAAFLLKYYGTGGQWSGLGEPMHTIVSKARMGLVTVTIAGEEYAVVDIGMRMLQPHELAKAQGLPEGYILNGNKTQQIARIGNSVSPFPARALVEAQFGGPGCPLAERWAA